MQQAVREVSKEYWQPANAAASWVIKRLTTETLCPNCQTEYTIGARFCHICGRECDPPKNAQPEPGIEQILDLNTIRQHLGLNVPSMIFLILGIACLAGALLTGFVYHSATYQEWDVVQRLRVEWLLGGILSMLAALLLKKK